MKRYGYKFENLDSYLTEAIDIRFVSVLLALICGVFTSIYSGEKEVIFSFMPISFVIIVLSFGAEFFKKTFLTAIILISLSVIAASLYYVVTNYNECIKYCHEIHGWNRNKEEYLTPKLAICILVCAFLYGFPILYLTILNLKKNC